MWPQLQIFCLLFKSSVLQPLSTEEKSRYDRQGCTDPYLVEKGMYGCRAWFSDMGS